jgi:hypothetical protein
MDSNKPRVFWKRELGFWVMVWFERLLKVALGRVGSGEGEVPSCDERKAERGKSPRACEGCDRGFCGALLKEPLISLPADLRLAGDSSVLL